MRSVILFPDKLLLCFYSGCLSSESWLGLTTLAYSRRLMMRQHPKAFGSRPDGRSDSATLF